MDVRMSSLSARVAAALILSAASLSASAAMIVPTGGTLQLTPGSISGSPPIAGEYGSFEAGSYISAVSTAHVAGNFSTNALRLSATASGVVTESATYQGRATGTIGFDLTDAATLSFSFLQHMEGAFQNVFADAAVTIRNAQGDIVVGCTGGSTYDFTFGGCALGGQPNPTPSEDLLPNDGFMQLLAGHYDISFDVDGSIFTGVPVTSDFTLDLSVVPLPAALPLLLSGLGVLGIFRRRTI